MKPLILGKGLLGSTLHDLTGWDVICRKDNGIDFNQSITYFQYLADCDYDIIINCIGYTKTWDSNKEPHWSTNYTSVSNLIGMCNRYNQKLVHISTDYIYWNSRMYASEVDVPVHFENWYTYTKVLADALVEGFSHNFLTIRTSYKPRPFPWHEAWRDLHGNFDYVDVIAKLIIQLIERDARGIYNVGTKYKNMYELAQETRPDVKPVMRFEAPNCISMNLEKMNDTLGL